MLQGKKQNISIHLWTSSAVCKSMHQGQHWQARFVLALAFSGQPAITSHWEVLVACLASLQKLGQKSTLSGPAVSQGRISLQWEDTAEERVKGGKWGKEKGWMGGSEREMAWERWYNFFIFSIYLLIFWGGGREGQKWRRRGAETFNLSLIFFKLLSSSALWMV